MPDGHDLLPDALPPEEVSAAGTGEQAFEVYGQLDISLQRTLSGHKVEEVALRNKLAQAYIDNMDADRKLRQVYAGRILSYLEMYSIGVFFLLFLNGVPGSSFFMEKDVATTLVGSTAVAAIGLVGFIARGLFRSPPAPPFPPPPKD